MDPYDYSFIKGSWIEVDKSNKIKEIAVIQERVRVWKTFYPKCFELLEGRTKIDSIYYSNAIEQILAEPKHIVELLNGLQPSKQIDLKILGYRDALNFIDGRTKSNLCPELFIDLHYTLMNRYDEKAGKIRSKSAPHSGVGVMGAVRNPTKPKNIMKELRELCESGNSILGDSTTDPMNAIPMIVLDYINLSPFENANGRTYRLLLYYLMTHCGYDFVRYVPVDRILFEDAKNHTNAIYKSSEQWAGDERDYTPFFNNIIDTLWKSARHLNSCFHDPSLGRLNKEERIRCVANNIEGDFIKKDISDRLPDISGVTIQQELSKMIDEGLLTRSGATKGTKYKKC